MGSILRRIFAVLVVAATAWTCNTASAQTASTEQRVALVIGNSAYKRGPLANPTNDAQDVAAALKQLGFTVLLRVNATQMQMKQAVREFGKQLGRGHVGLFFYAGHGVQVRDRNFLMPIDALPESEADTEDLAVELKFVLDTMEESQSRVNIVVLDACRDNPFPKSTRSGVRGLATVPRVTGTFISYATGPGQTAADGSGRNSPFTKNLIQSLRADDSSLLNVFQRVRDGVHSETSGRQVPWDANGVIGQFYFRPGGTQLVSVAPSSVAVSGQDAEIVFWESIRGSNNPAEFQAYLDQYPKGRFAGLARSRANPAAPTQAPVQVATAPATLAPTAPPVLSGTYNVAPDTSYPSKPVRIVVPFAPGGGADLVARLVAQAMSQGLGQQFVVDNRPGASGIIGTEVVARSPPDGYALLMATTATQAVAPAIYSRMPYDPKRDFAPIALVAESPLALAVPSSGPGSVRDLINSARSGSTSFASAGSGSMGHLTAELFKARTGASIIHVPYKGAGPAITDLMAGQVQLMFADVASITPHISSGRLRALAVTSQQRHPLLSSVPTFAEAGVNGVEASTWYAMFAPAGTPSGVASRLYRATQQAVSGTETASRFSTIGLIPRVLPPNDTQVFVQAESDKWSQVARAANVRAD